jgi:alpha-tubulin suppressor-like RCC1 family protein
MFAWGSDNFAQLGDGGSGMQASPEQIYAPSGVRYDLLDSGGSTSYAISTSGDVYAWGANREGQVGEGNTQTQMTPIMVDSGATLISSTAGNVVAGGSYGRFS